MEGVMLFLVWVHGVGTVFFFFFFMHCASRMLVRYGVLSGTSHDAELLRKACRVFGCGRAMLVFLSALLWPLLLLLFVLFDMYSRTPFVSSRTVLAFERLVHWALLGFTSRTLPRRVQ